MNYLPGRNFRESDLILESMNTVAKAENSINCFGSVLCKYHGCWDVWGF